jgi:outer membrane protein OmpA-like peptidoglycan-associated protein
MRRMSTFALSALLLVACGHPPKPAELVSFEQTRAEGNAETVRDRFPDLYKESERAYKRAIEAYQDGDAEKTLHYTRMAAITWRTAVARSQEKDAEDSLHAADNRRHLAEDELAQAKQRIEGAQAAISRMERIRAMQTQLKEAEAKASQEKKAAEAKEKVDAVARRLQEAESMGAARLAPGPLNKAQASFKLALQALQGGDAKQAGDAATAALVDADAVVAAAKPLFDVEEKARAVDARLRSLLEACAGVPESDARITQRGLTLSVRELFEAGKTVVRPDKAFALDQVVKLLKDYGEFKVVVEGHTDNQGRPETNMVLSQGRAQAVLAYLTGKGEPADRMNAIGKGDTEPVADNSTRDGRAQNRRVDVVFLRPAVAPAAP